VTGRLDGNPKFLGVPCFRPARPERGRGPVAAIRPFDTLEEAIAESNRLPYGLAGYAFTRSLKNSDLLARRLEVGMLWSNMPAMPSAEMPFGGLKDWATAPRAVPRRSRRTLIRARWRYRTLEEVAARRSPPSRL
jgi:acyl-CoA reductase-like NAD-dependent aldehyde dehydrogenase